MPLLAPRDAHPEKDSKQLPAGITVRSAGLHRSAACRVASATAPRCTSRRDAQLQQLQRMQQLQQQDAQLRAARSRPSAGKHRAQTGGASEASCTVCGQTRASHDQLRFGNSANAELLLQLLQLVQSCCCSCCRDRHVRQRTSLASERVRMHCHEASLR